VRYSQFVEVDLAENTYSELILVCIIVMCAKAFCDHSHSSFYRAAWNADAV